MAPTNIPNRVKSPDPRNLLLLGTTLFLFAAACGSGDDAVEAPPATPDPATEAPVVTTDNSLGVAFEQYEQYRAGPTACNAPSPEALTPMAFELAADEGLNPAAPITATVQTSCGDLVIELDPTTAPLAVNSFVFLARQGFYDGVVSHRIIPGFMFQAGDQTATGGGGPGYRLPVDEFPPTGFLYDRGVVAMANAGPESTGSQFFIMLGPSGLPANYTVIGRLVSGDDVLDNIAAIPVATRPGGESSLPLEALYIERIFVGGGG